MISEILSYLLDAWETVVDFAMMAVNWLKESPKVADGS